MGIRAAMEPALAVSVELRLSGGEAARLSPEEAQRLYDDLWLLVGAVRGALSAAAKVMEARQQIGTPRVTLDQRESDVVRQFLAKMRVRTPA